MSRAPRLAGRRPQPDLREALQRCRTAFLGVGVFSGLINVLALTGSLYMLQVYDRVLTSRSVPTLVGLTVLMVMLYAIFGVLDVLRSRLMGRIGLRIDRFLRERVFAIVLLLPLRVRQSLDALQPVRDLDQIRAFLAGPGPTAIFDVPWLPIYLAMVYLLHPWLGLLATFGAVVLVLLTVLTEIKSREPAQASARNTVARHTFLEAVRRNTEVIHASGLGRNILGRWDKLNEKHLAAQLEASDVTGSLGAVSRVLRVILQSAILGLGAYVAIRGEATAGVIIAAAILSSRALAPIEIAIANWRGFIAARQSYARLDHILEKIPARRRHRSACQHRSKSVAVQSLWVAAPGQAQAIVQDASFTLIGRRRPRHYRPLGRRQIDIGARARWRLGAAARNDPTRRRHARSMAPDALGRHIGYLPQDIELFDGTVAENIARLDEDPPAEAVIAAATAAGVHDMILHLPDGYDTRIGDGGMMLSAGQRQRIALARALYGDPFLVVLDEPNSNLDAEGDQALTAAIRCVRARGGIAIVIAHRPSALAGVDKLLVLANGQVQACGAKDEVLARATHRQRRQRRRLHPRWHCIHPRGTATMMGASFDVGRETASTRDRADGIRECLIAWQRYRAVAGRRPGCVGHDLVACRRRVRSGHGGGRQQRQEGAAPDRRHRRRRYSCGTGRGSRKAIY